MDSNPETNVVNDSETEAEKEKTVSLKAFLEVKKEKQMYKEKLEQFELAKNEEENKSLSEVEKLKKELAKVTSQFNEATNSLKTKEQKELKHSAYLAAKKQALGDGFILEDEDTAYKFIDKLPFNEETYENEILEFIEFGKKPKMPASKPSINFGANQTQGKAAKDYTGAELRKLHDENPDLYKKVVQERKNKK